MHAVPFPLIPERIILGNTQFLSWWRMNTNNNLVTNIVLSVASSKYVIAVDTESILSASTAGYCLLRACFTRDWSWIKCASDGWCCTWEKFTGNCLRRKMLIRGMEWECPRGGIFLRYQRDFIMHYLDCEVELVYKIFSLHWLDRHKMGGVSKWCKMGGVSKWCTHPILW